jgi:hypothetical protein
MAIEVMPASKMGGDFDRRHRHILSLLDAIVIGMNSHRHGNGQLVAQRVHLTGNVPVVDGAVGVSSALGSGNLDDDGRMGPLRRLKGPTDNQVISTIGGNGHRATLGQHRAVDHLAADDQGA